MRVPLESELPHLKRFGDKAALLFAEVKSFIGRIRRIALAPGKHNKLGEMQPEIRENFWPNTRALLHNNEKYAFMNEKPYNFTAHDSDGESLRIKEAIDHTIQIIDSGCASATIEDKAICFKMGLKDVGQALTQVESEVKLMMKHPNYAPVEYVGLLQNGPVWIAVRRRIENGKVLWTYIQTSPAFTVEEPNDDINNDSCIEIARLIEHTYCTADEISDCLLHPERRPLNALYTIQEYQRHSDDEDEDEDKNVDDHDLSKGYAEIVEVG